MAIWAIEIWLILGLFFGRFSITQKPATEKIRIPVPWTAIRWRRPNPERELDRVVDLLHEIQETLECGALPSSERWARLHSLPSPWQQLTQSTLLRLRAQGSAVLPTLRRLRRLAERQRATLGRARARAAQAQAQAALSAALAPLVGFSLYALLPGVSARLGAWTLACAAALLLTGVGALWMQRLAEQARWAGLGPSQQPWVLAAPAGLERFLAQVRSGTPSDLAWLEMVAELRQEAPALARAWGSTVWGDEATEPDSDGAEKPSAHATESSSGTPREAATRPSAQAPTDAAASNLDSHPGPRSRGRECLVRAGREVRRSLQVALMEGRPCTERVEAVLGNLQDEWDSAVEEALSVLPHQVLKPLFLCIAPAIFGLLGTGVFFSLEALWPTF